MNYSNLTDVYIKLEATSKRLEKTYYISQLLKKTETKNIEKIILLLQGRLYPPWDERKIGVASRLVIKAINVATGISLNEIEDNWRETGDLGEVAEKLVGRKEQATLFSQQLSIEKVFDNLRKLAEFEGEGTVDKKIRMITELLTSAKPEEARYITRTVLEELRVGVGEGAIRDAIVWAFFPAVNGIFFRCKKCGIWLPKTDKCMECGVVIDTKFTKDIKVGKVLDTSEIAIRNLHASARSKKAISECAQEHAPPFRAAVLDIKNKNEIYKKDLKKYDVILTEDEKTAREVYNEMVLAVEEAHDLTNDFSAVAAIAKEKGMQGLINVDLEPGRPIKVMLYQKAKDLKDAFERVGTPAALEYKYDGFRIQIHKKANRIILFTRRLENVTEQFPDVVSYIKKHVSGNSFIVDTEAVGYNPKTGKYLPFQSISQRIKRKYDIDNMAKEYPVELNVFDVIYYNGKNMLKTPFSERRKLLEKCVKEADKKIVLAKQIITKELKEAEKFYSESLKKGEEGIMAKNLAGIYKPGSRVGYGVKIKPTMESIDLVITGAEWGEGKRAKWLSSFTIACINEDGNFLDIGKVGTGFKELEDQEGVSFVQMTALLKPLTISQKGKSVRIKPEIVIEVTYEEIQKSPTYSSGFALRFPRILRLRNMEKSADDATSLSAIKELFHSQKQ